MKKTLTKISELEDRLCSYGIKVSGISPAAVVLIVLPLYLLGLALYILTLKLLTYLDVTDGWVGGVAAIGGLAAIGFAISFGLYFILLPFTFVGFHIIPPRSRIRRYTKIFVYLGYFALCAFILHALEVFDYINDFSFSELVDEFGSVLEVLILGVFVIVIGSGIMAMFSAIVYGAALYWDIMKFLEHETSARPPMLEDLARIITPSEWNSITAVSYIALGVVCIHAMLLSEDPDDAG